MSRTRLGATLTVFAAALAAVTAATGLSSSDAPFVLPGPSVVYQGTNDPADRISDARRLGCTRASEPANFAFYSLGLSFEGLPLKAIVRQCADPDPPEGLEAYYPKDAIRANFVSYLYGDCDLDVDPKTGLADGGCAYPVEVQTWPACERTLADYTLDGTTPYPRRDVGPLRGVPAASFDGGERIELYAGKSTIVVFGNEPAQVRAAAAELRAEPDDLPLGAPDEKSAPTGDLPEPPPAATTGGLSCSA